MFLALFLACGQPVDPAWAAAADATLAQAASCSELGTALTNQCADASVGAAAVAQNPMVQFDACRTTFSDAYTGLQEHPNARTSADLNAQGQQEYSAILSALSQASACCRA